MASKRWQQVEELYHAVLERPASQRQAYLAAHCADDLELFSEVEELLSFDGSAGDFIEENALVVAAQQLESADLKLFNRNSLVGERIGVYKVLAPLGSGAMGDVYRAHDERLLRDVAIKILPPEFSRDADRLRRFEREARATSALNHPNILTVYDIARHDGVPCIVAELLEGEELRAQLNHGPLPVRKAIEYGQQVTSGLAAAHEKGITHRDLKPENIFVTKDGRVKILDFGLAKLRPSKQPDGAAARDQQTDPGTVMGTVGYMSPEQVRGLPADHRADIFSFGVIFYEMLTGRQPFLRKTKADTNLAVLSEDPEALTEVNNKIPPQLERIVCRCLEKRPAQRFYSAHDLGFALDALSSSSAARLETDKSSPAVTDVTSTSRLLKHERWMWIAATALAALTALGFAWSYFARQPAGEAHLMKLSILPLENVSVGHLAISPDGRWLAFTAATGAKDQLWVRALDATEAKALSGTEGAAYPFWSPDSQHLGFFAGGKLKRIEVPGGVPATLCDVTVGMGGTWNRDGIILFSSLDGVGLSLVSATGGDVTPVIKADHKRGEADYSDPSFLPDGRHFLYYKFSGEREVSGVYVASLDGRVNQRLLGDDSNAVYATSGSGGGYLLFGRERALMAQPFDTRQLRLTHEPFPISGQVGRIMGSGGLHPRRKFSVSENGVLALDPLPLRLNTTVDTDTKTPLTVIVNWAADLKR